MSKIIRYTECRVDLDAIEVNSTPVNISWVKDKNHLCITSSGDHVEISRSQLIELAGLTSEIIKDLK